MSVSAAAATGIWTNWAAAGRQKVQASASAGQESPAGATNDGTPRKTVDPVASFTELTKGTPEQRLFKAWLARHHMSREQYDALSLDEKKKLDEDFRKELEEQAEGGVRTGRSVDVVV